MTNTSSLMNTVISTIGGAMVRKNGENFLAVQLEDGTYAKVAVSALLAKDTKTNKAFNFDECAAQYADWRKEQDAKAAMPKKEKTANTEAQARRDALDAALTNFFATSAEDGKEYTATDIFNAVGVEGATIMSVGSSAIRLADNGVIHMTQDAKGKRHYTK